MPAHRKASVRELATAAYELDSGVVQGHLRRSRKDNCWTVDDRPLDEWLSRYEGQDVVVIIASLEDDRPLRPKVCRTCGTEYTGIQCPRCSEARLRLRGR